MPVRLEQALFLIEEYIALALQLEPGSVSRTALKMATGPERY